MNIKRKRDAGYVLVWVLEEWWYSNMNTALFISIQCFMKCWWWCSLVINGNLWLDMFAGLGSWSIIKMLPLVIGELHNQKDLRIWNFQLSSGIIPSYLHLGKHHHLFHYWSCCLLIRYGLDLVGAFKGSFLAPWYTLYL